MVRDLTAMPGVEIVHDLDLRALLSIWPGTFADFGDAMLASFCLTRKDAALASFDAGFVKAARKVGVKVHSL